MPQDEFEYQETDLNTTSRIWSLWDNVEKYCRAGEATDDNMAHAHLMRDT